MRIENDGYIGIPVEVQVLYNGDEADIKIGCNGTPVILYVTNTCMERVGTESDEVIIGSILARGYIVVVLDYLHHPAAVSPALDWSLQGLRKHVVQGEFFEGEKQFPCGDYVENFVVPAGYDVSLNHVYWSIDKHGVDGTLEKIVEVWNVDFRGIFGEQEIVCRDGVRRQIKDTWAKSIEDCVKPDGSPLDLNLYMHIIYPVKPKQPVPVMCLACSTENLAVGTATADRPQLNGFLFRGYAGVTFDYGYVPMARQDHYGFFNGHATAGCVTGDDVTYSIQFYNDKRINGAAMRYIRYLVLSEEKYSFDLGAVGVYGNSKGGWMTFLGEKNPETLPPARYFPGHHGEGKEDAQPWLTWQGEKIASNAQFIYASCGGADNFITAGHAPTYVTANVGDKSGYEASNQMVNLCRIYDVPSMYLELDIGHTLGRGTDMHYGVDAYNVLFDLTDYYLKGAPVKVAYISNEPCVKFTGPIPAEQIEKVQIRNEAGILQKGNWSSQYGRTQWYFAPAEPGKKYSVYIPADLQGANGQKLGRCYQKEVCIREQLPRENKGEVCTTRVIPNQAYGDRVQYEIGCAPDGEAALKICKIDTCIKFNQEEFYVNSWLWDDDGVIYQNDTLIGPIGPEDYGCRYHIQMKIYDTVSRWMQIELTPCSSEEHGVMDLKRNIYNIVTTPDQWTTLAFDYTVYDREYSEAGNHVKSLVVRSHSTGNISAPLYLGEIICRKNF